MPSVERVDSLAHRSPESHAFFELQRDRFRNELRVELWLMDFLNIDEHFAFGLLREILLQLFDFRALASNNDAGTRRVNGHAQLVAGTIHFNGADTSGLQTLLQEFLSSRSSVGAV